MTDSEHLSHSSCFYCCSTEENGGSRRIRTNQETFNFHDEDFYIYNHSLEEVERKLFGIVS